MQSVARMLAAPDEKFFLGRPVGAGLAPAYQGVREPPLTPILDSRKLLAFTTLARLGSFTMPAQELNLTQSAVSHAIKSLEDDLPFRLFDRLGHRVKLTPVGK